MSRADFRVRSISAVRAAARRRTIPFLPAASSLRASAMAMLRRLASIRGGRDPVERARRAHHRFHSKPAADAACASPRKGSPARHALPRCLWRHKDDAGRTQRGDRSATHECDRRDAEDVDHAHGERLIAPMRLVRGRIVGAVWAPTRRTVRLRDLRRYEALTLRRRWLGILLRRSSSAARSAMRSSSVISRHTVERREPDRRTWPAASSSRRSLRVGL